MFRSFRRKHKKGESVDGSAIRASPSLPELSAQGIAWPSNLVDLSSIAPPETPPKRDRARTSFSSPDRAPIAFHLPFRGTPGKAAASGTGRDSPISSLYMKHPPSAFDNWRSSTSTAHTGRPSQRRARVPTTFNLMVAGGQGTGKTALLRLLLDTADVAPGAGPALDRFMRGGVQPTRAIQTVRAEICESRFDRVLFSAIDTPGLDFHEGRELKLERQVTGIVRFLDAQYAETMSEESKVVRQSKGDNHVHLCIYIIDPASIMTPAARRQLSSLPSKTRSETTISYRPPDDPAADADGNDSADDSEDEYAFDKLTMSPAELRVVRRLAQRANVLPVIGHADSLTDEKLAAIKECVRREFEQAGMDFGVFGPAKPKAAADPAPAANGNGNGNGNGAQAQTDADAPSEVGSDDDATKERASRPLIQLRLGRKSSARRSRSRSRSDLQSEARDDREPVAPDPADTECVANVRFSAPAVARTDLSAQLPFAVVSPEHVRRRRGKHAPSANGHEGGTVPPSEDGHAASTVESSVASPVSPARRAPYAPEDLKGVFTRKFRWGTIDVLDPSHCDFAAMRTAVLSTHMKVLKMHTKEVLYERYRTEKLLARRATQNIGEKETKRMLEDLGL